jgi:hypothetical protein
MIDTFPLCEAERPRNIPKPAGQEKSPSVTHQYSSLSYSGICMLLVRRKKQIAYCQSDWGHRRAELSTRLGATRFQCSLDALAKSINAVTFSTFPYTSFTTLHIPTRARSSRKNSPRMSLKVPKAGGPDLFKAGYKYMSGLEEAVLRNIQAVGELTEIVRTSFGPNG